jgi:hypothetical protein
MNIWLRGKRLTPLFSLFNPCGLLMPAWTLDVLGWGHNGCNEIMGWALSF